MAKSVNLGNLNFELIMDDQKFNASIQKNLKAARDMNIALSDLLNLRKQVSQLSSQMTQQEMDLMRAMRRQNQVIDAQRAALGRATRQMRNYNREKQKSGIANLGGGDLSSQQSALSSLTSLATKYVSLWGASALLKSVMNVTAEFEMQRMALRAMLKDTMAADEVYGKIWNLALRSPFNAKELVTYAKQLAAYSIPVGDLYDTTKMLADVSAGLGVGMDRLVLAYGQIRSAAFLRGQEVRQLTEAGIPILEELRKQFVELGEEGVTAADVFDKISKRMVSFEMVENIFKNMTSEGGKFYQMQEKQAETLKGKIMILKDAFDKMFNSIGESNEGTLKSMVDTVTSLTRNYEKVIKVLTPLIATYGAYKVAVLAAAMAEKVWATGVRVTKLVTATEAVKRLTKSTTALGAAFKFLGVSNPYAAIVAGVTALISVIMVATSKANALQRELGKATGEKYAEANNLVKGFDELVKKLRDATEGSQDFRDAISALNNQYSEYLPNLLNEKNALDEVAAAENRVKAAIMGRAKAMREQEGMMKIGEKFDVDMNKAVKQIEDSYALRYSRDTANNFVSNLIESFRKAAEQGKLEDNIEDVYEDTYRKYFGREMSDELNSTYIKDVKTLAKNIQARMDAEKALRESLDVFDRFGKYDSIKEQLAVEPLEESYRKKEQEIRAAELSTEEFERRMHGHKVARLESLISLYKTLDKEAGQGTYEFKLKQLVNELNALKPADLNWIQEIVNPLVGKDNQNRDLNANVDENYVEYIDKLRKEYKSVFEEYGDIKDTYAKLLKDQDAGLEISDKQVESAKEEFDLVTKRKALIESIGKALGVSVTDKLQAEDHKDGVKERIQTDISTIKDLLKWTEKFRDAGMKDSDIKKYLLQFFPDSQDVINAGNYKDVLLQLADALDKYDKKAAQALRDDVGGYGLDEVYDRFKAAQKAGEKLKDFMDKLVVESELSGTGVVFDISNIVRTYRNTLKDIADKKKEAYEKFFDATSKGNTDKNINDFVREVMEYEDNASTNALAKATDALDTLADKWVKDWAKMKGIDLDGWSNITTEELTAIRDALESLFDENGNLIALDGMEQSFEILLQMPGAVETLTKAILAQKKDLQEKADEQINQNESKRIKDMAKSAKYAASEILKLTDALGELAEETKDANLSSLAETADGISEVAKSAAEGYRATGSWIGAAIGGLSSIATLWVRNQIEAEKLARTIRNAGIDSEVEKWRKAVEDTANVFGENDFAGLTAAADGADKAKGRLTATLYELTEASRKWQEQQKSLSKAQQNKGKNRGEYLAYERAVERGFDDIESYYVKGTGQLLGELVESLNEQLYDKMGNINTEALRKVLEMYGKDIKGESYDFIFDLEKYGTEYEEFVKQVTEATKSLFGSTANDMTDAIIERWIAMGDAAADYGDIIDGVGESLARMMIKNLLMKKIFDETLEEKVVSALSKGETKQAANLMREAILSANEYAVQFSDILRELNVAVGGSGTTMGNAIQSVTEDTASLLASYINGMRADLAAQRTDVHVISADMKVLLGLVPTAGTLEDYLVKIEANSYDTAQNTWQMMDHISSVMAQTGEGSAFRVYMP